MSVLLGVLEADNNLNFDFLKPLTLTLLLLFGGVSVMIPTASYAISLDDDDEDAEDVTNYLQQARASAKKESFNEANRLLKKAKAFGLLDNDIKETESYIATKKKERDDRIEKERLAKLEKERKERERLARVEREEQNSYESSSSSDYSSSSSSSTIKTFTCTYSCRTDEVFLSTYTDMGTATVNASSEYLAKEKVAKSTKNQCQSMRDKQGNLMRYGAVRCSESF